MGFSLVPDRVYHSVLDIKADVLRADGITLLMADLDNTLISYGEGDVPMEILKWREELRVGGVDLFLLSNSRKPWRPKKYAEILDIPYIGHAGKPKRTGFLRGLAQMGRKPEETAMVGDQIFTDILGANRSGIRSILIYPIQMAGNPGRYVRYAIETPFRYLGRRKTK